MYQEKETKDKEILASLEGKLTVSLLEIKHLLMPYEFDSKSKADNVQIDAVVQIQLIDQDNNPISSYKSNPKKDEIGRIVNWKVGTDGEFTVRLGKIHFSEPDGK